MRKEYVSDGMSIEVNDPSVSGLHARDGAEDEDDMEIARLEKLLGIDSGVTIIVPVYWPDCVTHGDCLSVSQIRIGRSQRRD